MPPDVFYDGGDNLPNVLPLIRTKREKFAVKVLNSHKFSQKVYRFGDLWEDCGCKTGAVAKKCDSNLHHKSCKNGNPKPFLSRFASEKVPGFVHFFRELFCSGSYGVGRSRGRARTRARGGRFFGGGGRPAGRRGKAAPGAVRRCSPLRGESLRGGWGAGALLLSRALTKTGRCGGQGSPR